LLNDLHYKNAPSLTVKICWDMCDRNRTVPADKNSKMLRISDYAVHAPDDDDRATQ
jgi:hypothetical protein